MLCVKLQTVEIGKLTIEPPNYSKREDARKDRWEEQMKMKKSIYNILRGTFLISDDSFKNWRIILFISALAIVMIASAHSADEKVYKIAKLNDEVKELKSMMSEARNKLTYLKMESTIESKVAKKGIETSEIPPKKIIVKSQN